VTKVKIIRDVHDKEVLHVYTVGDYSHWFATVMHEDYLEYLFGKEVHRHVSRNKLEQEFVLTVNAMVD